MEKIILLMLLVAAVVGQAIYLNADRRGKEKDIVNNSTPEKLYCPASAEEAEYVSELTGKLIAAVRKDGPAPIMCKHATVIEENRDRTVTLLEAIRVEEQPPVVDRVWRSRDSATDRYWIAECRWQGRRICFNYVPGKRCLKLAAVY